MTQDQSLVAFFKDVYPQSAIESFLKKITDLLGDALARVQTQAVRSYARLGNVFSGFFLTKTTIPWGMQKTQLPLYKVLLGNFSRFEQVAPAVLERGGKELRQACTTIEAFAKQAIDSHLALK